MANLITGILKLYLEVVLWGLGIWAVIMVLIFIGKHKEDKERKERAHRLDEAAQHIIENSKHR